MEEKKYTRDQIKDAIWKELQESDHTGENNDRAYEVIGIVMAGIDKIVVGEAQTGPVFVNAAIRSPDHDGIVHLKIDGLNRVGNFYEDDGRKKLYVNGPEPYILFEDKFDGVMWLDESGTVSQDAHEREVIMQAFDKVRKIFQGRSWVMEGRGSYPYNDDRYKEEVRYMYDEFDAVAKDTWKNIKSHSSEYRRAIVAEYLATAAAESEELPNDIKRVLAAFVKVARHIRNYPNPQLTIELLRSEAVVAETEAEWVLGENVYDEIIELAFKEKKQK